VRSVRGTGCCMFPLPVAKANPSQKRPQQQPATGAHRPARYWFCGSKSAFWMDVMWTATERASMVPVVADASSGVNTMWLLVVFAVVWRGVSTRGLRRSGEPVSSHSKAALRAAAARLLRSGAVAAQRLGCCAAVRLLRCAAVVAHLRGLRMVRSYSLGSMSRASLAAAQPVPRITRRGLPVRKGMLRCVLCEGVGLRRQRSEYAKQSRRQEQNSSTVKLPTAHLVASYTVRSACTARTAPAPAQDDPTRLLLAAACEVGLGLAAAAAAATERAC